MSFRIPASLPLETTSSPGARSSTQLTHGQLLTGRVTRVAPDGTATVRFGNMEARTPRAGDFQTGQRIFAQVQRLEGDTLLSMLPNVEEGDILTGTFVRGEGTDGLARFGETELALRLPASGQSAVAGEPVNVQVQMQGGRPVLQMLPTAESGQVFNGTVLSVRADGTAVLDVNGTTLIALASDQLEPGMQVQVHMLQTADKMLLQALQPGASPGETGFAGGVSEFIQMVLNSPQYARLLDALISGELRVDTTSLELLSLIQQFSETNQLPAWLANLTRALESILLSPQRGDLAQQLAGMFKDSGVFLESRMLRAATTGQAEALTSGDLKLALLLANQKLSQMLASGRTEAGKVPQNLAEISSRIAQLLDSVKAEQLQNLRTVPSNEIYIQLPFAEGTDLERVELMISPRGKQDARVIDPKNVTLTLALTTSNLGRIRAALSIVEGQISCQIRAERQSVVDFLRGNANILREGLEKLDFRVANIDCMLSKGKDDLGVLGEQSATVTNGIDLHG